MTLQNNLPFQTDADAPQEKATNRNIKPLAVVALKAMVLEEPRLKKLPDGDLYATYCAIQTNYRPFNTDIFSKEKPNYSVGEEIDIEISATAYKLRFKRQ